MDYFSFGERLAVVEDSGANSEGMTPSYNMLADLIESDLSRIDTILTPSRWESPSSREKRRVVNVPGEYLCDVYISHAGDAFTTHWIREFSLPVIQRYWDLNTAKRLNAFFDLQEVRLESKWGEINREALNKARVGLAILTPRYGHSTWCMAEFQTFLKRSRESHAAVPLIFPVVIEGESSDYPHDVQRIAWLDLREFAFASLSRRTARYAKFEEEVRRLTKTLIRACNQAPVPQPNWPVVSPDEVTTMTSPQLTIPQLRGPGEVA